MGVIVEYCWNILCSQDLGFDPHSTSKVSLGELSFLLIQEMAGLSTQSGKFQAAFLSYQQEFSHYRLVLSWYNQKTEYIEKQWGILIVYVWLSKSTTWHQPLSWLSGWVSSVGTAILQHRSPQTHTVSHMHVRTPNDMLTEKLCMTLINKHENIHTLHKCVNV